MSENLGVEELCVSETCKFCGSTKPEKAKLICFEVNFRVNWLLASSSFVPYARACSGGGWFRDKDEIVYAEKVTGKE